MFAHVPTLRRCFVLLVCCCLIGLAGFAQTDTPGESVSKTVIPAGAARSQTPPEVVSGVAVKLDHYDPANMLRLAITLNPPHPLQERQFLEDVQNKKSPLFHQFLTPEQWNQRFAPTPESEQAVVDWAKSQGLTITHRYHHRLAVDVEAPAGVIEKALNITINSYRMPAVDGLPERTVYSNDRDPAIPSNLQSIVFAVLGLNSIEVARPAGGTGRLVPRPDYVPGPARQDLEAAHKDASPEAVKALIKKQGTPAVTPPASGYYTPADMFSSNAYNYGGLMNLGHCCNPLGNSGSSPKESSIAIASYGDVSFTDVQNFQAAFPYLAYNLQKVAVNGGYTCGTNDDNCGEVTLDTEWSMAMANSEGSYTTTAKVYIYEGSGYTNAVIADVYNQILDDNYTRVMSTSWGWKENSAFSSSMNTYNTTMQSVDSIFANMVGEGWTLVAASGDQGSTAGCGDAVAVQFPSSDPNVVGEGGTQLSEGSPYEVGWMGGTSSGSCSHNGGGSTGGVSEYWSTPGYQSSLGYSKRAVPDLALDSYYGHDTYLNGGWAYFGGTSVAAPMQAGFFAQENAYLLYEGSICGTGSSACGPLGNPLPAIYTAGVYNDNAHNPFYDITSGCNSNDVTAYYGLSYYCAGTGYDQVTGWGSQNMMLLAWALNWQDIPAYGEPYTSWSGPATGTTHWYNSDQIVGWTIVDYSPDYPGTGIAGFTQGWDSIPADPTTEPHGGSGNSFYSGPEYVNTNGGCLSFNGAGGCAGGSGQGCHTAHVRGWNNQGQTTGDTTYGPLCYDSVAPTITIGNNPAPNGSGWNNSTVKVTLTPTDPGGGNASGILASYYAIDTGACYAGNLGACTTYSSPFNFSSEGQHYIYYFTEDNAGNFSSEPYEWVYIDLTPPVSSAALSGDAYSGSYIASAKVTLSASDNLSGVQTTSYQLDGGSITAYSAPITVSSLGTHTVAYWSTDYAGNTESHKSVSFKVIAATPAKMTSPANQSKLSGTSATFTWSAAPTATDYILWVGSQPGAHDVAYVNTKSTSASVTLPQDGRKLFVYIWSEIAGTAYDNTYWYVAPGTGTPASITSPTPGSTFTGATATFTWSGGVGLDGYYLYIGTKPGAHDIDFINPGSATTSTVNNLPTNGEKIYVYLWSLNGTTWLYHGYTYYASGGGAITEKP